MQDSGTACMRRRSLERLEHGTSGTRLQALASFLRPMVSPSRHPMLEVDLMRKYHGAATWKGTLAVIPSRVMCAFGVWVQCGGKDCNRVQAVWGRTATESKLREGHSAED